MDSGPPPVLAAFLLPSIVLCILYATSKYHNRRRTEFSTYGLYMALIRRMLRGDDGQDLACLAYYPQCEIYNSDLDARNALAGAADNPNLSMATQADGAAEGVRVDIAVLLHRPCVYTDSPRLPLNDETSTTINQLFQYICDSHNSSVVFDPSKYSVLRIARSDIVMHVELKPPVSRRGTLLAYLLNTGQMTTSAATQADDQFNCAMMSWRYNRCEGAWLIGGAGDVFRLRWATPDTAVPYEHKVHIQRRQADIEMHAMQMFADWDLEEDYDQDIPDIDSILSCKPPFTDAQIHAFIKEHPEHDEHAFEQLNSESEMLEHIQSGEWTKPMRIGSPVADFYLSLVRKDILKRAQEEMSCWDDIVDLTEKPDSERTSQEKTPRAAPESDVDSDPSTDRDPHQDAESQYSQIEDAMDFVDEDGAEDVDV